MFRVEYFTYLNPNLILDVIKSYCFNKNNDLPDVVFNYEYLINLVKETLVVDVGKPLYKVKFVVADSYIQNFTCKDRTLVISIFDVNGNEIDNCYINKVLDIETKNTETKIKNKVHLFSEL